MKYLKELTFYIVISAIISSCYSHKDVAYFQDLKDTARIHTEVIKSTYEIRLQPDDIIEIIISSINPEVTAVFNLGNTTSATTGKSSFYKILPG